MKNVKTLLKENEAWIREVSDKLIAKTEKLALRYPNYIGYDAEDGKLRNGMDYRPNWWTNGFWGGMNFLLYDYTKNDAFRIAAENSEELLATALEGFDTLHHDVGFMYHLTSGARYRLLGNKKARTRELYAASTLSSRFILGGDFILAWNTEKNKDRTIIDTMMNLPLLYWASDELGDDRFKRIAVAHAEMAMCDHIRDDGSVIHICDHDRETGEVYQDLGGQGYAQGSSWSRGQSWALYGFTLSYLHTKDERFLNTAKLVANYFIANCCDDWLPRLDFRAPEEPLYYDSTAGAIAACGMIELAKVLPENEGGMYMNAALNILKAMEKSFVSWNDDEEFILGYGSGAYPVEGKGRVNKPIIYGDFYFVEAMLKLSGQEFLIW